MAEVLACPSKKQRETWAALQSLQCSLLISVFQLGEGQLATRTLLVNCLHSNNFLSCVLPNKDRFLPFLGLPQDYTDKFLINYQITPCHIMTSFASYLGTSPH